MRNPQPAGSRPDIPEHPRPPPQVPSRFAAVYMTHETAETAEDGYVACLQDTPVASRILTRREEMHPDQAIVHGNR